MSMGIQSKVVTMAHSMHSSDISESGDLPYQVSHNVVMLILRIVLLHFLKFNQFHQSTTGDSGDILHQYYVT